MADISPTKRHNVMCAVNRGHSAAYVAKKNGLSESEVMGIVEQSRGSASFSHDLIENLQEFTQDIMACPRGEDEMDYLARIGYRITKYRPASQEVDHA